MEAKIINKPPTYFDFLQRLKQGYTISLSHRCAPGDKSPAIMFMEYLQDFDYVKLNLSFKEGKTLFTKI